MKNNHTPTPWVLMPCDNTIYKCDLITNVMGDCIAEMDSLGAMASSEEVHANAAHIVRCVNSHDELLAALKACVMEIPSCYDASLRAKNLAIAAIANAEAK